MYIIQPVVIVIRIECAKQFHHISYIEGSVAIMIRPVRMLCNNQRSSVKLF